MPAVPARGVSTLLTHLGKPGGRPFGARLWGLAAPGARTAAVRWTATPADLELDLPPATACVRSPWWSWSVCRSGLACLLAASMLQRRRPSTGSLPEQRPSIAGTAVGDDSIYTGSILYMPQEGRTCRQLLFDNQSGRFSDNGYVDCVNAAYRSPGEPKFWSAARALSRTASATTDRR